MGTASTGSRVSTLIPGPNGEQFGQKKKSRSGSKSGNPDLVRGTALSYFFFIRVWGLDLELKKLKVHLVSLMTRFQILPNSAQSNGSLALARLG